jgi:hypothetical protein
VLGHVRLDVTDSAIEDVAAVERPWPVGLGTSRHLPAT